MRRKSLEVAPLEALRQKFLHSADQAKACRTLQEAEVLVKDVTALGRWPLDIKNNPTERILIRRIRELRDAHASGALQSALDGAAQPTVIARLEDLQRKFLQETADRMLGEAEEAVDPNLAFAEGAAPSRYSPDLSPSRYSLDSEVEDEARGSDGEPAPKKGKFAAAGASQPGAESDVDDNDGSFYVVYKGANGSWYGESIDSKDDES